MYPPSEGPNPYAPPVQQDEWNTAGTFDDAVLASRGRRFLGNILDSLVYVVAFVPAFFIGMAGGSDDFTGGAAIAMGVLMTAVVIVQAVLVATTGQSIAKKLLGMRIVQLDGSPIGFVRGVLVRSWALAAITQIPVVGGIIALVDALYIFGAEQRCLHDVMAGSKVVMVEYSASS